MRDWTHRALFLIVGAAIGYTLAAWLEHPPGTDGIREVRLTDECPEPAERDPAALARELPQVPHFRDPGILRSNLDGRIFVRWTPVPNAKEYEIRVMDGFGNEVQRLRLPGRRMTTMLRDLKVDPTVKETPYTLVMRAFDQEGNPLPETAPKRLAMLPMKNLAPPSIKSIRTED